MRTKRNLPAQTWVGLGAYLLALGGGVLIGVAVAIALVAVGTVSLLLGIASTERSQRQVPGLGRLPLVHDHGFQVVLSGVALPAQSDAADQKELLRLAHEVWTELETARYQLEEAKKKGRGWFATDMLPAAKFDAWQKSPATGRRTEVMKALRGYYVWAHRMNIAMQEREAYEYESVGQVLKLKKTLMLSKEDIAELDEGLNRIRNAQEHLQRLIDELAGDG